MVNCKLNNRTLKQTELTKFAMRSEIGKTKCNNIKEASKQSIYERPVKTKKAKFHKLKIGAETQKKIRTSKHISLSSLFQDENVRRGGSKESI